MGWIEFQIECSNLPNALKFMSSQILILFYHLNDVYAPFFSVTYLTV